MKRSGKFYRKNEAEVMQSIGLKPTKNSGSTWMEKEDGQNEFLICQLKSTDAQSIRIKQKDIRILEQNASIAHKIPIFAIQFLNTNEVWLMSRPEDYTEVSEFINTGEIKKCNNIICEVSEKEIDYSIAKQIKSSVKAREKFKKEQEEKYKKIRSAK